MKSRQERMRVKSTEHSRNRTQIPIITSVTYFHVHVSLKNEIIISTKQPVRWRFYICIYAYQYWYPEFREKSICCIFVLILSLLNLNTQITLFNKRYAYIKAIVSTTTKYVFHIDNWKCSHKFHCKSFLMAALQWLLKRKMNRTILSFGFPISICDNIMTIWFYVPLVWR